MELETIKVVRQDGSEAVINKADFDAELHTLPGAADAAAADEAKPKRRGRPKKAPEAK